MTQRRIHKGRKFSQNLFQQKGSIETNNMFVIRDKNRSYFIACAWKQVNPVRVKI